MAASAVKTYKLNRGTSKQSSVAQLTRAMVDSVPLNVMVVDRDLKIQYLNPASLQTLKTLQHLLPVKVEDLVGCSIDVFHKDPQRIRTLLSSDKNLPHKARIQLGPEKLDLLASALYDEEQNFVGIMQTWSVATERARLEEATADQTQRLESLTKGRPFVEFEMDGTIDSANELFVKLMGYELAEIKGKNHSIFVDEADRHSVASAEFWSKLAQGIAQVGEYKRVRKGNQEVWLAATYYPVLGLNGKPYRILQFATDVTAEKLKNADYQGQMAAINKAQATIEFKMDGTVITANENFLKVLGYSLDEIKGKHHSMFVDEAYRQSADYKEFWTKLNRGEYQAAEYKRIGKGGKEVWIQASYNPIFDLNGKPFKVVKFATDVTAQKLVNADYEGQIAAIQQSQATIEFKMDGTIVTANENFLKTLGYSLTEIKGRHHSMFVDEAYRQSSEYKEFWASLNSGQYRAGEFKRIGKGGKEVWIQGSYNPIRDLNGKPFKVVKYATNVTARVKTAQDVGQIAEGLASASEELTATSQQMSANAEETSAQANVVSAGAEQVNRNLQTVARGRKK